MKTQTPTATFAARLRELLSYDPQTGVFVWLESRGRVRAGSPAGADNGHGYTVIRVDGHLHMAHRLAWLLVHGEWPDRLLDHANGDKRDNRIANLRQCNEALNAQNQRRDRANRSGRLGVHKAYRDGKWKARITIGGQERHLGLFGSVAAAAQAYEAAKAAMHPFDRGIRG